MTNHIIRGLTYSMGLIIWVLILKSCAASTLAHPVNSSADNGTPIDWITPYISAINDTITRIYPPLDAEIEKKADAEINARLVPINATTTKLGEQITGVNTTLLNINGTLHTKIDKTNEDLTKTINEGKVELTSMISDTKVDLTSKIRDAKVELTTKIDAVEYGLSLQLKDIKTGMENTNFKLDTLQTELKNQIEVSTTGEHELAA